MRKRFIRARLGASTSGMHNPSFRARHDRVNRALKRQAHLLRTNQLVVSNQVSLLARRPRFTLANVQLERDNNG